MDHEHLLHRFIDEAYARQSAKTKARIRDVLEIFFAMDDQSESLPDEREFNKHVLVAALFGIKEGNW